MPDERSPEVEALAWALCADGGGAGPGKCDPWKNCVCGAQAASVVAALRMAGFTIVPMTETSSSGI